MEQELVKTNEWKKGGSLGHPRKFMSEKIGIYHHRPLAQMGGGPRAPPKIEVWPNGTPRMEQELAKKTPSGTGCEFLNIL